MGTNLIKYIMSQCIVVTSRILRGTCLVRTNCQILAQHPTGPPGVTRTFVPLTLDLDCFSIFAPRDIIDHEHDLITGAVRIVPPVIITAPPIS